MSDRVRDAISKRQERKAAVQAPKPKKEPKAEKPES